MAEVKEVRVPDIGGFDNVPVIEVMIKAGDTIKKDQSLITLESDKATMEVPSTLAGTVKEVKVSEGSEVSEGTVIATVEAGGEAAGADSDSGGGKSGGKAKDEPKGESEGESDDESEGESEGKSAGKSAGKSSASKPGDKSDKAPPAPEAKSGSDGQSQSGSGESSDSDADAGSAPAPSAKRTGPREPPVDTDGISMPGEPPYASPAVRAFARELGVDIGQVEGSGRKGRIVREDVQGYVKHALAAGARPGAAAGGGGLNLLPWPKVDFSKFGEVEEHPLSRIQKISGANLARNWAMIPHVTQHEDADITDMEAFRKQLGSEHDDVKITPLVFLIKAVVAGLKQFPQFNASLDASGEKLILKKYFHVGIAVDTPDGLVVPVLRDCDRKGLLDLARELAEVSNKARAKKLGPADMSGGCFSISSLGGIGGTAFTPIINAPEVAILGVSRSRMQPVWNGQEFAPRLTLPLSVSYDHRVIDGAMAARFTVYLAKVLSDLRRLLV